MLQQQARLDDPGAAARQEFERSAFAFVIWTSMPIINKQSHRLGELERLTQKAVRAASPDDMVQANAGWRMHAA